MRDLRSLSVGTIAFAMLWGCRSGVLPSGTAPAVPATAWTRNATAGCGSAAKNVTIIVCISVPKSGVSSLVVTDSIYGDPKAIVKQVTLKTSSSQCARSGSKYLWKACFEAPAGTLNQIQVNPNGKENEGGAFPVEVRNATVTANAVLGGSIASLSVVPFHATSTKPGQPSSLPLGQTEHVWIVAKDQEDRVIIGAYTPTVSISVNSGSNLVPSSKTVGSSFAGESLIVHWLKRFMGSSTPASLMATASSSIAATAPIYAASGVAYYPVGGPDGDRPSFGPGPVAVAPNGDVYFVIDDDSFGGCKKPGACTGLIGRLHSARSAPEISYVALREVPGVSQLYLTTDGALWMASFQPVGAWDHRLPVLYMPPGKLSEPQQLPASFGEASGFTVDASGNLWISACEQINCKQNHDGTPILVETSIDGTSKPKATIDLPTSCAKFGYAGFSVGDVAYDGKNLYVLGLNDGSAPPARGTIWQASPTTGKASCLRVPPDFNPSPYFAQLQDASEAGALVFGAGGNSYNFRWQPDHGFYSLADGKLQKPAPDLTPVVTANHVSASGGAVYYAASGTLDQKFSGLGTYVPSNNGAWSIFPSASFSGDESNNGVAAVSNGAWYTASGVCGDWKGVCLADAIIVPSNWGALPGLYIPPIKNGGTAGFGVITELENSGSGLAPLIVHSGPFDVKNSDPSVCEVASVKAASLTFSVTGRLTASNHSFCQLTISNRKNVGIPQALVVHVSE